ncbi:MAG: YxeA family protein [Vagococcus sp.]|uniref:YxeA family protein n=1 Tax=Vagococcus sp. TaxID=1933889 RepID=UPI002FC73C32
MKKFIISVVLLGAVIVGTPIVGSMITQGQKQTQNNDLPQLFDRFNVLIKKEPVYVVTDSKQSVKQEQGGYIYHQSVVSESGKTYDLSYYAGSLLKESAILKLDAKGRHVETWEEVQKDEVPKEVLNKLSIS